MDGNTRSSLRVNTENYKRNSILEAFAASTPFDDLEGLAEKQAERGKGLPFVEPHPSEARAPRRFPVRTSDPPNSRYNSFSTTGPSSTDESYHSNETPLEFNHLEDPVNLSVPDRQNEFEFGTSEDGWADEGNLTENLNQNAATRQWGVNFTAVQDSAGVPAKVLARQLVLIDCQSFRGVTRGALESFSWAGPDKWKKAPSVAKMIQQFNQITLWVSHEILATEDLKARYQKIIHFIDTAKCCLEMNDFNGAKCIISGLESSPVYRLEKTWAILSRSDRIMFDRIKEMLSPQDNFSKYRKKLKRATCPLIPFLGVHLGDLIYLNEAKKKEIGKPDLEAARQRESQIARLIDQLQTFQIKCVYDFEEIPPVRSLFLQEKFIPELQNFLEDHQFQLSYNLEPKKVRDSSSVTSRPVSTMNTSDEAEKVNNDLLSLSIEQYGRSISVDNIGIRKEPGQEHSRQTSDGASIISTIGTSSSQTEMLKRIGLSLSLGQKKGTKALKQASAINEAAEDNLKRDEELVNMAGSPKESSSSFSDHSFSVSKDRFEVADIFGNKYVLKESVMSMKIKKDATGKKPSNRMWEEYWVRLFPGMLVCLPKKPLSVTEKHSKTNMFSFNLKENSSISIASDYKKKQFVFRLIPTEPMEILFQAKTQQDLYEWVAIIQKTAKRNSLSR